MSFINRRPGRIRSGQNLMMLQPIKDSGSGGKGCQRLPKYKGNKADWGAKAIGCQRLPECKGNKANRGAKAIGFLQEPHPTRCNDNNVAGCKG